MNQIDCTAIIAVKNGTNFLPEAIASIRAQTTQVSRILVIDDNSEDETVSLCKDLGIECLPSSGKGQTAATNTGIRLSETKFIAILDHDDWWDKEKTTLQSEYLIANPDAMGVYSRVVNVFTDGRPNVNFSASRALGASLLRRRIFNDVGLIDESLTSVNVIVWWSEVAKRKIRVDSLDIPALYRRVHDVNFGIINKDEAEENLMQILRSRINSNKEVK